MDCTEVTTGLWEYLDHALGAEEAAAVSTHLGGCPDCWRAYACDRAFLKLLSRARLSCACAPRHLVLAVRTRWRSGG
jgi:anti-sigma factor (TIGR02949 family)